MSPFVVFGLIVAAVVVVGVLVKKKDAAKPKVVQPLDLANAGQNGTRGDGKSVNEMRAARGLPPDPNQP